VAVIVDSSRWRPFTPSLVTKRPATERLLFLASGERVVGDPQLVDPFPVVLFPSALLPEDSACFCFLLRISDPVYSPFRRTPLSFYSLRCSGKFFLVSKRVKCVFLPHSSLLSFTGLRLQARDFSYYYVRLRLTVRNFQILRILTLSSVETCSPSADETGRQNRRGYSRVFREPFSSSRPGTLVQHRTSPKLASAASPRNLSKSHKDLLTVNRTPPILKRHCLLSPVRPLKTRR